MSPSPMPVLAEGKKLSEAMKYPTITVLSHNRMATVSV